MDCINSVPRLHFILPESRLVTSLKMAFVSSLLLKLYRLLPSPGTPSAPCPLLGKLVGAAACLSVHRVWREVVFKHGTEDTNTHGDQSV